MSNRSPNFYNNVNRICSSDMTDSEIKRIKTKLIEKETQQQIDSLDDFVNIYTKASEELNHVEYIPQAIDRFKQNISEIKQNSEEITTFLESQGPLLNELKSTITKRDFCHSLNNLNKIPEEIDHQTQVQNFELATKLLTSFMKFILNPKYPVKITVQPKQNLQIIFQNNFSPLLRAKYRSFLHDNTENTNLSIQALGFLITCAHYNLPGENLEQDKINSNILDLFSEYFDKWKLDLLSIKFGPEVLEKYVSAGRYLKLIKEGIENYILRMPFWPDRPNFEELKQAIIHQSNQFYQTIYSTFCETKNFTGFFYSYSNVFQIENKNADDIIRDYTASTSRTWRYVYPQCSQVNQIIMLVLMIDFFNKCSKGPDSDEALNNLYENYLSLLELIKRMKEAGLSKPDITPFCIYATQYSNIRKFSFAPKDPTTLQLPLFTIVYFSDLFHQLDSNETNELPLFDQNYIPRIVSAISALMVDGFLKSLKSPQILSSPSSSSRKSDSNSNPMDQTLSNLKSLFAKIYGEANFSQPMNISACPQKLMTLSIKQAFNGIYAMNFGCYLTQQHIEIIQKVQMIIVNWAKGAIFKDNPAIPQKIYDDFKPLYQSLVQ